MVCDLDTQGATSRTASALWVINEASRDRHRLTVGTSRSSAGFETSRRRLAGDRKTDRRSLPRTVTQQIAPGYSAQGPGITCPLCDLKTGWIDYAEVLFIKPKVK